MVIGVGTDILAYQRIEKSLDDEVFLKAVYTQRERDAAFESDDRKRFLFARFAGKEAVFKALGINGDKVRLTDIEILPNEDGVPIVSLYGHVKEMAGKRGIKEILLSLSWEVDYALAVAIAQ